MPNNLHLAHINSELFSPMSLKLYFLLWKRMCTSVKSSSIPVVGSLTTDRPECSGVGGHWRRESKCFPLLVSLISSRRLTRVTERQGVDNILQYYYTSIPSTYPYVLCQKNIYTHLRNFWKAASVSWMGNHAGSLRKRFSTSACKSTLNGGSPWGSCGVGHR